MAPTNSVGAKLWTPSNGCLRDGVPTLEGLAMVAACRAAGGGVPTVEALEAARVKGGRRGGEEVPHSLFAILTRLVGWRGELARERDEKMAKLSEGEL